MPVDRSPTPKGVRPRSLAARTADAAVVFLGLSDQDESEGLRPHPHRPA